MFWPWMLTMMTAVFAGIGIKWLADRVFPPPPRVIEVPAPESRPRGGGPRLMALDDTMDVLGAGYEAGIRMGRHTRPEPAPGSTLERLGLPADAALLGNGWHAGPYPDPYSDGPPVERPADWPDEAEAWVTPGPGQP